MAQIYFPVEYFPLEYWPLEYWPVITAMIYSTDPRRIFVVPRESRTLIVENEERIFVVPVESRTMVVEEET